MSNDVAVNFFQLEDGRYIMAGSTSSAEDGNFAFVRLLSNGVPDTAYGPQGHIIIEDSSNDSCIVSVRYDDEYILMGGSAKDFTGHTQTTLIKTNFEGQLDSTFGNQGRFTMNFDANWESIQKMIVLPDGKILAGGHLYYQFPDEPDSIFIFRLLANGIIDSTFGDNGIKLLAPDNQFCITYRLGDMVVDQQGRILISSEANNFQLFDCDYDLCDGRPKISRFLSDGTPDLSFGSNRHYVLLITWPKFDLFGLLFGYFFVRSAATNSKMSLNQSKNL